MADTPERSVFFVQRILQFADGQVMTTPVGVFDNRPEAEKSAGARGKALEGLLMGAYLCRAQQTVDGGVELVNTGVRLAGFTGDLGIKNIAHRIMEIPVHGADLVIPQKRIILPH